MTLNGAIMQLTELWNHPTMPVQFKPAIEKVIETVSELEERTEECTETHECDCSRKETHWDVIYRQTAIDALKEHRALYCDNTPDTFSKLSYAEKSRVDELDTAIATLVNLPSAEPEIIRCKDCKHGGENPIADGRYWCEVHDTFMYYCSDAERRTDEQFDKQRCGIILAQTVWARCFAWKI